MPMPSTTPRSISNDIVIVRYSYAVRRQGRLEVQVFPCGSGCAGKVNNLDFVSSCDRLPEKGIGLEPHCLLSFALELKSFATRVPGCKSGQQDRLGAGLGVSNFNLQETGVDINPGIVGECQIQTERAGYGAGVGEHNIRQVDAGLLCQ